MIFRMHARIGEDWSVVAAFDNAAEWSRANERGHDPERVNTHVVRAVRQVLGAGLGDGVRVGLIRSLSANPGSDDFYDEQDFADVTILGQENLMAVDPPTAENDMRQLQREVNDTLQSRVENILAPLMCSPPSLPPEGNSPSGSSIQRNRQQNREALRRQMQTTLAPVIEFPRPDLISFGPVRGGGGSDRLARSLLISVIGEDTVRRLEHGGTYVIQSKRWPGTEYHIPKQGYIRIVLQGFIAQQVCIEPSPSGEPLPWPDIVLARIKAIEADETVLHGTGVVQGEARGVWFDEADGALANVGWMAQEQIIHSPVASFEQWERFLYPRVSPTSELTTAEEPARGE